MIAYAIWNQLSPPLLHPNRASQVNPMYRALVCNHHHPSALLAPSPCQKAFCWHTPSA
uniref:Uncharacterized protein n=1 Tax=Oryza glumipatula TaxID=40148 RepID=A0A0E0BPK7_9ORYZ